ncbi:MAG: thioesterase family protein [Odoribacteraceae bacterium]|jgi:predicted thioesterase|nr:thioesterase family protein [Odoribacteraceae bacterium]
MNTSGIIPGRSFSQEKVVTREDTAIAHGSGKLAVFATPALVGFMENTALRCLEGMLDGRDDTVGTSIDVKHLKATAVGKRVTCRATIAGVDGRCVRFTIEARDEVALIGVAVHERFIVDPGKFMQKLGQCSG